MSELERLPTHQVFGKVAAIQGLLVEVSGLARLSVGDHLRAAADARTAIESASGPPWRSSAAACPDRTPDASSAASGDVDQYRVRR